MRVGRQRQTADYVPARNIALDAFTADSGAALLASQPHQRFSGGLSRLTAHLCAFPLQDRSHPR